MLLSNRFRSISVVSFKFNCSIFSHWVLNSHPICILDGKKYPWPVDFFDLLLPSASSEFSYCHFLNHERFYNCKTFREPRIDIFTSSRYKVCERSVIRFKTLTRRHKTLFWLLHWVRNVSFKWVWCHLRVWRTVINTSWPSPGNLAVLQCVKKKALL